MDIEKLKRVRLEQDGLSKTLGMDFISTPEPDTCMARMKVGRHNRQVFGFLSGGATLALAENLAGIGSESGQDMPRHQRDRQPHEGGARRRHRHCIRTVHTQGADTAPVAHRTEKQRRRTHLVG